MLLVITVGIMVKHEQYWNLFFVSLK